MSKLKVYKTEAGFKVYEDSFLLNLPFQKPQVFCRSKKRPFDEEGYDLVFKELKNANKYIELRAKSEYDLEDKLGAVNIQLQSIFSRFNIDPQNYTWCDAWCGAMHWGVGLSRIIHKPVLCVDIDKHSYEPLIDTKDLVEFRILDTDQTPLPGHINALFLRSTIGVASLKRIIELNPNLDLMVVVPEGLNSNEIMEFKREVGLLKKHFDIAEKDNVTPDILIKGSHTNIIKFNFEVPVLFAHKRKKPS